MELKNKHIVITGGTSGIGLALVRQLARHNTITVIARRAAQHDASLESVHYLQADLSDSQQLNFAANSLLERYRRIDILINNAAVQFTPEFHHHAFDYDSIQQEIALNFTAVCQLTWCLLPVLHKAPKAVILNINSGLALAPKRSSAVYCASKAALDAFSRSLSYQLEETNISVQQAFLPLVETAMTQARGGRKLSAEAAARDIIRGIQQQRAINDIGVVKWLRLIMRLSPSLGRRIMRRKE